MQKLLIFLVTLVGSIIAQEAPVKPDRRDPEAWKWVVPDKIPGMIHSTLESPSMKRRMGFNVYLPPAYEESPKMRFPVVYYLHGAGGSEKSAMEIGDLVRNGVKDGSLGDVIYVFPNSGHYGGYRDWPDGQVMAETWIIGELIPHIDKTYRTIASREGRALSGWSMGGAGSIRFLLKHHEMFCAAATFSAAFGYSDNKGEAAVDLLKANADKVRGRIALFMVVGEDDGLFGRHKPFLEDLERLKIDHTFQSQPGVGHNLGAIKDRFGVEAVRFLAKHYATAREAETK